jgi:RNA recognition motif-containing protein
MGNRLYVGNLSFNATNDTVRAAFSAFGEITDVHVVSDRETGQSRGFGFVTMGSADAAQKAISEMNGACSTAARSRSTRPRSARVAAVAAVAVAAAEVAGVAAAVAGVAAAAVAGNRRANRPGRVSHAL